MIKIKECFLLMYFRSSWNKTFFTIFSSVFSFFFFFSKHKDKNSSFAFPKISVFDLLHFPSYWNILLEMKLFRLSAKI